MARKRLVVPAPLPEQAVVDYGRLVWRWARWAHRLLPPRERRTVAREDFAQEGFATMARAWAAYHRNGGARFSTYLVVALRHRYGALLRRAHQRPDTLSLEPLRPEHRGAVAQAPAQPAVELAIDYERALLQRGPLPLAQPHGPHGGGVTKRKT